MHIRTLTDTGKLGLETRIITSALYEAKIPLIRLQIEWMSWIYATSENIRLHVFPTTHSATGLYSKQDNS